MRARPAGAVRRLIIEALRRPVVVRVFRTAHRRAAGLPVVIRRLRLRREVAVARLAVAVDVVAVDNQSVNFQV